MKSTSGTPSAASILLLVLSIQTRPVLILPVPVTYRLHLRTTAISSFNSIILLTHLKHFRFRRWIITPHRTRRKCQIIRHNIQTIRITTRTPVTTPNRSFVPSRRADATWMFGEYSEGLSRDLSNLLLYVRMVLSRPRVTRSFTWSGPPQSILV